MTDGIIQKVINCNTLSSFKLSNGQIVVDVRDVQKLKQELITEIDKWIKSTDRNNVREALIGDTQQ